MLLTLVAIIGSVVIAVGVFFLLRASREREAASQVLEDQRQIEINERTALLMVMKIWNAQGALHDVVGVDRDGDGRGEFGDLHEISAPLSDAGRRRADVQGVEWKNLRFDGLIGAATATHRFERAGYVFQLHLPDRDGNAVKWGEDGSRVDPDRAERVWCVYAWPKSYGQTGTRTFFVAARSVPMATDSPAYGGTSGPLPGAAFVAGGPRSIIGTPADNQVGQDGNRWEDPF